jgi:hypothetical protein
LKDLLGDIQTIGDHSSQLIGEFEDKLTDHGESSISDIMKQIHDVTKDVLYITKSISDTVKNIIKLGDDIGAVVKFAEGLSETAAAVSGLVGVMQLESAGEIATPAAIHVGGVSSIELLSETVRSIGEKDYSDVFLRKTPYLTQIATYIPTVPKELFNYYDSFGNIPLTTNYQTFFNYYKDSSCNGVAVLSDHIVNNNLFPIFNISRKYGEVTVGNSVTNAFIKVLDSMLEIWSTNAMNLQSGIKQIQLNTHPKVFH